MRYPPVTNTKTAQVERFPPGQPGQPPVLSTREHEGSRERVLTVTVRAPTGEPYTLRLMAAMAQVDRAVTTSQRLSLTALALATLALVLLQTWQGKTIKRRLGELSGHIEALRAGNLERTLAKESSHDELAALRDVLVQATASLKQARDSKERLLADAAHELRTPLTLMRTNLDLALRKERPVEELKAALHETRDEVDRLALLAAQLLDTAALAQQTETKQACDVAELVERAVEQVAHECELRNLTLSVQSVAHLTAQVRPHAVRQAVDNLLSNAMKYAERAISVELACANGHLTFVVRDDGPGIPREEHELVFEPFHRVQQRGHGAGLGLAIVREVARSHGGRAFVIPSSKGAQVVLELAVS
jgi:signal transduction histidine kinase